MPPKATYFVFVLRRATSTGQKAPLLQKCSWPSIKVPLVTNTKPSQTLPESAGNYLSLILITETSSSAHQPVGLSNPWGGQAALGQTALPLPEGKHGARRPRRVAGSGLWEGPVRRAPTGASGSATRPVAASPSTPFLVPEAGPGRPLLAEDSPLQPRSPRRGAAAPQARRGPPRCRVSPRRSRGGRRAPPHCFPSPRYQLPVEIRGALEEEGVECFLHPLRHSVVSVILRRLPPRPL